MKYTRRGVISTEAIGFQWDKLLFTEMKLALQSILVGVDSVIMKDYSTLEKVIFDRTGILVSIKVLSTEHSNAAIYMPAMIRNHPLYDELYQKHTRLNTFKTMKLLNIESKGWVDHGRVKVGGVFSKINQTLELTTGILNLKRHTVGEICAVILHELGHAYYCFTALAQTVRTNMVLMYAMRELDGVKDQVQRITIVENMAELLDLKLDDVKSLSDPTTTNEVIQTVIANESFKRLRSELGTTTYDMVSWEQLADHFAARQGAGIDLALALEKIGAHTNVKKNRSIYTRLTSVISGVKHTFRNLGLDSFSEVFQFLMDPLADSYDAPKVRLIRIREQLTTALKDPTATTTQKKQVLEDIVTLDALISELEQKYDFIQKLWMNLTPRGRRESKQMIVQRELESLLANRLFDVAATLQTLA